MFTTFPANEKGKDKGKDRDGDKDKDRDKNDAVDSSSVASRPKRSQVARACDYCRQNRIKCDNTHPCTNCKNRRGHCSLDDGLTEFKTIASANKENERLRLHVKDLTEQLKYNDQPRENKDQPPSPPVSALPSSAEVVNDYQGNRKQWEGIRITHPQTGYTQFYGPSSSFYFISRISAYLSMAFQQPHRDQHLLPNSASRSFASPTSLKNDGSENSLMRSEIGMLGNNLSRTQHNYFLGLFWQTYHCTIPILNEASFMEHYESLWETTFLNETRRKSSPLVDIVLAVCLQYGTTFVTQNDTSQYLKIEVDSNDATIAGRWFYHRSQTSLAYELENPTLSTLQCHLFSIIYLRNASFLNMSHNTVAIAVQTAHVLGLHHEPPSHLAYAEKELHKRLWWMVSSLESKSCMVLGRPWLAHLSDMTCNLPADDNEVAILSGSTFISPSNDITWLSYHRQAVKLILAVRVIQGAFYEKCTDVLTTNGGTSLYEDAKSMEICADYLLRKVKHINDWKQNVPNELKNKRTGTGEPLSTDGSPLVVGSLEPLWLQRQRLLLELLYHDLMMTLYRPFICFPASVSSYTSLDDGIATSCLNHAMATTHIMHQMLTDNDILSGWHEVYQFQWNAALSMVGFSLAYPVCAPTPSARRAIHSAIGVLGIFGNSIAIAASAAIIMQNLERKVDSLINRVRASLTGASSSSSSQPQSPSTEPVRLQPTFDPALENMSYVSPQGSVMMGDFPPVDAMPLDFSMGSLSGLDSLMADDNEIGTDIWIGLMGD